VLEPVQGAGQNWGLDLAAPQPFALVLVPEVLHYTNPQGRF
jgi:hypothetical protein